MADLASRYAEALLTAAKRENALPEVMEEIQFLAREFSQSAKVFYAPVFSAREQLATVEYVLNDKFHPLTKRFICLLAAMRRLGGICRISDIFVRLARREMRQIDLYITVHEAATPEMESELIHAACDMWMFDPRYLENVVSHITVDKNLLGGFIAECEGMSWDCSLRTRLMDMSKAIRKI